jgi:hypothetical protein
MQNELAALSSDHLHAIALRSGHFVQSSANGQPDVVIAAVLAVVHAARTHTHLPTCPRLFHTASVECRTWPRGAHAKFTGHASADAQSSKTADKRNRTRAR